MTTEELISSATDVSDSRALLRKFYKHGQLCGQVQFGTELLKNLVSIRESLVQRASDSADQTKALQYKAAADVLGLIAESQLESVRAIGTASEKLAKEIGH